MGMDPGFHRGDDLREHDGTSLRQKHVMSSIEGSAHEYAFLSKLLDAIIADSMVDNSIGYPILRPYGNAILFGQTSLQFNRRHAS